MSKQFFKNSAILGATEVFIKLKAFVLMPLLTSYLGALNYGVWSQVNLIASLLVPLMVLGTGSAIIKYLPGIEENEKKSFFNTWILSIILLALLFSSNLYVFREELANYFFQATENYVNFIILSILNIFINLLLMAFRNWYRIEDNAKGLSTITISQAVMNLLTIFVVLYFDLGIYNLVLLSILANAIVVIVPIYEYIKKLDNLNISFKKYKKLLKFGIVVLPATYSMWGLNVMDRIFLTSYTTLENIGIYTLMYTLGYTVITIAVQPLWIMYPSKIASLYNTNKKEEIQKLFERVAGTMLFFTIPIIFGLYFLSGHIVQILSTDEFLSGSDIIPIITLGYLFHMTASFYISYLNIISKQKQATSTYIFALFSNLILNFLLIPKYGIYGAAVATMSSFMVQFAFALYYNSNYRLLQNNYFFIVKIVIASFFMGIGILYLKTIVNINIYIDLICLSLFGFILYMIISYIMNTYNITHINLIRSLVQKSTIPRPLPATNLRIT